MQKISLDNYSKDRYYPAITQAAKEILAESIFVAPVEVFIRMKLLSKQDLEDWRFGRIPYLERVIKCNLAKASRSFSKTSDPNLEQAYSLHFVRPGRQPGDPPTSTVEKHASFQLGGRRS